MERDWIPPEPAGVERVGSDEDLSERTVRSGDFEGERAERDPEGRLADEDRERPH